MKSKTTNEKTFRLVRAISDGKNIDAYKLLEQAMKEKIADKIDNAIKQS